MKLIELLSITDENTNVYIHQDGNIVSQYDGRNGIDIKYINYDYKVNNIWTESDGLHIEIELD